MPLYDFICEFCGVREEDYYVPERNLKYAPICKSCDYYMTYQFPIKVGFLLKSSDLPGNNWEGFYPSFNRHIKSKREALSIVHDLNVQNRDKSIEYGIPFKPIEYLGPEGDKEMKEWEKMRVEGGADLVNKEYLTRKEEAQHKKLEAALEPIFNDITF